MKNSIVRLCGVATVALLFLPVLNAAGPQQIQTTPRTQDKVIKAPRDARQLRNRPDLTDAFKERPEIKIIVGLETPQESGELVARTSDMTRQQLVATRLASVLDRAQGLNVRNIKRFRFHPFVAMTVDSTALAALLADPDVTSVSEDGVIFPLLVDSVAITRANSAWADGFRGAGQTIAVIDSGLDKNHPFLAGKVVAEACFSSPEAGATTLCPNGQAQQIGAGAGAPCPDTEIGCWHGTHVAGIAAGNYGLMSADSGGLAPSASVMSIQVFQKDCATGTCQLVSSYSDIMLALEHVYSLRNAYSIAAANLSLGGMNFTDMCDNEAPGVTSIIQSLRAANIATVIASGNAASSNAISFPGCISSAVSVGATTKQNAIASFSNSASFLSLLAPGSVITSSVPGGNYGATSGTSMAAPHVAGAWATLKSAKPSATVSEVLTALVTGGMSLTDPRNGTVKSLIQVGDTSTQIGALGVLLGRNTPADAEIIIDNAAAGVTDAPGGRTFTGSWCTSSPANHFGTDALVNCPGASATYRWTPTIPTSGTWDVYVWWSAQASNSNKASIKVVSADGSATKLFDQRAGGGQWVLHGRYNFNAGASGYVQVSGGATAPASADAVKFVPLPGTPLLPVVTISAPDPSATEVPLNTGTLTVSRTGNLGAALAVQYSVSGTATSGVDYSTLSGTVTIPAGASTASITVTPIDDAVVEAIETVVVTVSTASGYTVGSQASATVKITSEDVAGGEIVLDNAAAGTAASGRSFTGSWCTSSPSNQFGADALANCTGGAAATYRWTPSIPTSGSWDVYVWWGAQAFQSATASVTVVSTSGPATQTFNQQTGGGQWVLHGRYTFGAGTLGYVEVSNNGSGHVSADAVRFVPVTATQQSQSGPSAARVKKP